MIHLAWLVPIALGMGAIGLIAFLWSMRSGQSDDLDGAAERVLFADAAEAPLRQDPQTVGNRTQFQQVGQQREMRTRS